MNNKVYRIIAIVLLASVLLTACKMANSRVPSTGDSQSTSSLGSAQAAAQAAGEETSPTPRPTLVKRVRPSATPTQDPAAAQSIAAEQAVRDYFAALEKGSFDQAAEQLSTFSLMVFSMTRGDASSALNAQKLKGAAWSGLQIGGTSAFGEETILVHVTYTLKIKEIEEKKDELWPVRLENGSWRCNWNNLIDFRSLQAPAQTMNGVTLKPTQINRFSDRLQLVFLAQNRTNSSVVLGQVNEDLGTFHFGDQAVIAEKTQIIMNPLRSIADMKLEVKGLYETYPDTIEIRKWKNYKTAPWYVFQLQ